MRILMVCLGNICRSPLAEGILQERANAAGLSWEVDSAGTLNYHVGNPPHLLSRKVAAHHGIDISGQRCRQFQPADLAAFDHIFAMDPSNIENMRLACEPLHWQQHRHKVRLLLDINYPGESKSVPDPYYGTEADYYTVFELIDQVCQTFIQQQSSTPY